MAKALLPHSTGPRPGFTTASHLACLPFSLMSFFRDICWGLKAQRCRGPIWERNILKTQVSLHFRDLWRIWFSSTQDCCGVSSLMQWQRITWSIQSREKVLNPHRATLGKSRPWCFHPAFLALSALLSWSVHSEHHALQTIRPREHFWPWKLGSSAMNSSTPFTWTLSQMSHNYDFYFSLNNRVLVGWLFLVYGDRVSL